MQLLVKWYETQKLHVLWGNTLSEGFSVTNGVGQGGILSPYLFNIYTDELSEKLDLSGVGCRYLGSVNHLCYADDMVLLSPTPQGLQKMLDICTDYAGNHNPRPTGGGYFEPPSRFLAISSKPMQVSPPNLQYPLSQHFYTLCQNFKVQGIIVRPQMTSE